MGIPLITLSIIITILTIYGNKNLATFDDGANCLSVTRHDGTLVSKLNYISTLFRIYWYSVLDFLTKQ